MCHIPLGCFSFGLSLTLRGCSWAGQTQSSTSTWSWQTGHMDGWKMLLLSREMLVQLEERVNRCLICLGWAVTALRERRSSQVQWSAEHSPDKEQRLPRAEVMLSCPALKGSLTHPASPHPQENLPDPWLHSAKVIHDHCPEWGNPVN